MRRVALALSVVVLVAGCASSNPAHRQAEADDDGVQATGVLPEPTAAAASTMPKPA